MSKIRVKQKPNRVFEFLMGTRHPKVTKAMERFGFSEAVLQDGWNRLETCAELAVVEEPSFGPNSQLFKSLDAFEHIWFAVAKASLKGNYPKVHHAFLANLRQTTGRDTAITVGTFLKRLREMEAGEGAYAEHGPEARALLTARGLTESVAAEAEELLATLKTMVKFDEAQLVTTAENAKAEHAKAVAHLWAWYLEWSAIARVAVKDRRLLRSMGFLNGSGRGKDSSDDSLLEEDPCSSEQAAGLTLRVPSAPATSVPHSR